MLPEWMGTWTQAVVPHQHGEAMDGGHDCPTRLRIGRNLSPGSSCRSLAHVNSALTALAEVLMKLTESCVIEQHIDKLLKSVEPTNLGLGTPDAAALIVRIVRGWANDMGMAPTQAQDADVVLPIDPEYADGRAFRSTVPASREGRLPTARSDLRSAMGIV